MAKKRKTPPKQEEPKIDTSEVEINESISETQEPEVDQSNSVFLTENESDDEEIDAEVRAYRDVLAEKGKLPGKETKEQDSGSSSDEDEETKISAIALKQRAQEIQSNLPWMETMDILTSTPLPFSTTKDLVHDDLKREVIFYNAALEAVHSAKALFLEKKVPFTRPDDFYAEMVKSDDHMRKVKDRLLFESKKISAFEQRKANRETKLRSKENKTNSLESKSRDKRQHFDSLQNWSNDTKQNARKGMGNVGTMDDDNNDQKFKRYFNDGDKNPRRSAADRKYGFGGSNRKQAGHFKSADKKALNDYSDFKRGQKNSGGGNKRPGKQARVAKRQKRG